MVGEFLALAVSLEHFAVVNENKKARILGETLDDASDKLLENRKGPSRKVNELDNRGSHFYLALYWAEALAKQDKDANLKTEFSKIYDALSENEETIVQELIDCQGDPVNIEGYYLPNEDLISNAMRPSKALNTILNS